MLTGMGLVAGSLLLVTGATTTNSAPEWNQWLGGSGRQLTVPNIPAKSTAPEIQERWRRSLGSGFAGISIWGDQAVTAMTDGKQDVAVLLDTATGAERWRFPLDRTRKRAEGVPLGPLSTPALDGEACYVQGLDGRFVCLGRAAGDVRWEVNLKRAFQAHEPGYGFASSPLLTEDLVILLPAGSSSSAIVALNRATGTLRWRASLGTSTEYASATLAGLPGAAQVVAQLGEKLVGVSAADGRVLWEIKEAGGGLWTPSVLNSGEVFFPGSGRTLLADLSSAPPRQVWSSPVFEGVMGPVVELHGQLIGYHQRRLTGLDVATGNQLWQRAEESDGQLLSYGPWLIHFHDRTGILEICSVDRTGLKVCGRQSVCHPTRSETPLTFSQGVLYLRLPEELVALKLDPLVGTN
ncbi:MAG: PQQ-like beta-propeller repeat protein [Verrucomicrobia bacterium]|nr:PQQ-like beta-propeller repeat protein [Verrucomicrobiota bacterium]